MGRRDRGREDENMARFPSRVMGKLRYYYYQMEETEVENLHQIKGFQNRSYKTTGMAEEKRARSEDS